MDALKARGNESPAFEPDPLIAGTAVCGGCQATTRRYGPAHPLRHPRRPLQFLSRRSHEPHICQRAFETITCSSQPAPPDQGDQVNTQHHRPHDCRDKQRPNVTL